MKIKTKSKDGVIFQVEMDFEEHGTAVIGIEYSGNLDVSGEAVLEFEWAAAEEDSNPDLTEDQLEAINDILECGWEERIVCFLRDEYANTNIRFDAGEYKHNPTSILYENK